MGLMPKNFDKDIFFHIVACKINEIPLSQMGTWLKFFQDFFKPDGHETIYASNGNEHFSLNNVTIRPTKIMNGAEKNWAHFRKQSFEKILLMKVEHLVKYSLQKKKSKDSVDF